MSKISQVVRTELQTLKEEILSSIGNSKAMLNKVDSLIQALSQEVVEDKPKESKKSCCSTNKCSTQTPVDIEKILISLFSKGELRG